MYLKFFGLDEPPFSITPDPRFVYLGRQHEDALAHLRYGLGQEGSGGFLQLTGEVGTGKTTLSRLLLEDLPDNTEAALILNPLLEPIELLETLCEELGIDVADAGGSAKALTDRLNAHLLEAHAAGRTVVVLIDEAQNLSPAALEQIRLLTNLETARKKLLQIILLGQPELRDVLARADLRQLAQRITARFHLAPLVEDDVGHYIAHRLQVAGGSRNPFTRAALRRLHRVTDGVPRLVNVVADRALLAAYAAERRTIDPHLVDQADAEVRGVPYVRASRRWLAAAATVAAVVLTAGWFISGLERPARDAVDAAPAAAAGQRPVSAEMTPVAIAAVTPAASPAAVSAANPTAPPGLSLDAALERLLTERGIALPATPANCRWSIGPGVFCLEQRGRWQDLESLGRMVLVAVADGWLPLTVGADTALDATGKALDRAALEAAWSGRFVDVWQMPGYVSDVLREGDRGPGVLWIKAAAAQAQPPFAGMVEDPYFGPELTQWTLAFQQSVGVRSDGLVGRETLQQLSRFADVSLELP
ncbi:MAG: AAA family ATPase [Pseudomonadota bacterium]